MKKIQVLVGFVLAFSLFVASPSLAADKSIEYYFIEDVPKTHHAYEQLERFLFADILDGYVTVGEYEEDGEMYEYTSVELKPQNTITRAQFTKMLVNALNLEMGSIEKSFSDVNSNAWYYDFVQIASSHGIIQGKSDGTFKPHDKITRAHMALMIYRAFEQTVEFSVVDQPFKDVLPQNAAYEAIAKVANVGIIKGYGAEFKPSNFANRSHAVLMIDRALHLETGTIEDEAAALAVVERNIKEEMPLFKGQIDTQALETLYRETTTGYLLASSLMGNLFYGDLDLGSNGNITFEQIGEHKTSIYSLNKRLAVVRIDNLVTEMTMNDEDMTFSLEMDISGYGHLKKMADGSWKLYHIDYDDDDYDLQ